MPVRNGRTISLKQNILVVHLSLDHVPYIQCTVGYKKRSSNIYRNIATRLNLGSTVIVQGIQ